MNTFLSDLNKQQRQACRMPPGPVLVLAGPGTGKTRVLIARIIWNIKHHKIPPENILALTFTNKAAGEIRQRLIPIAGIPGENVWTGTIHGFALQILRKYHERAGLSRHFTICDGIYQHRLVSELCTPHIREHLDSKVRGILLAFSHHVIKGKPLPPFAAERYREYKAHLDRHQLIDFDQILVQCHRLLTGQQDILAHYQHQFQAILIDEFQDTDAVQYDMIKLLAAAHRNIFIVADDDQSIYTWRGASPENIKKFIEDFKIAQPVLLRINYRSGARIMDAATRIIEKTERLERNKPLEIAIQGGEGVAIHFFNEEKQEIDFLLKKITDWSEQHGAFRDVAVIYPYHRIGQSFEPYLIKQRIPYQMAQGHGLLDHPAISKLILYLRLTLDPEDDVALEQLTGQEVGQPLYKQIKAHALQRKSTFRKALYGFYRNEDKRLGQDLSVRVQRFVMQLANLVNLRDFYRFDQFMSDIIQYMSVNTAAALESEQDRLQDITGRIESEPRLSVFDPSDAYKVYHTDARLAFLAGKLLEKTGIRIADPDQKDAPCLALDKPAGSPQETAHIPVYLLKDKDRQGGISCLFKYLQWHLTGRQKLDSYVVLDLETTDRDPETCGIVEFAAIRVQNGRMAGELTALINPQKPIHPQAQAVHGITPEQLVNKPAIEQFWPRLRSFIGEHILIAHNGYNFDFPILDRFARKIDGKKLSNSRFDTLVLARNIFPGASNSIDSLMNRYGLVSGNRHRALEDVKLLNTIFNRLQDARNLNARKISFEMFLDIVSLGNYIENQIGEHEDRLFFIAGARKLITPYGKILSDFNRVFGLDEHVLAAGILDQLERLQPGFRQFGQDESQMNRLREMAVRFNNLPVKDAIAAFLGEIALQQSQDELHDINAVSLLTYHAAKGLEFDKVVLVGLENDNMPGFHATRRDEEDDRPVSKKLEEQRRLFYVGMTRAKSELIMTAVRNRGGWERQSSPFLKDLQTGVLIKNEL